MILLEEQGLIRIFDEAYKIYKEFVPMLLPYKGAGGMRFRKYYVKVEMTNRTKNQGDVNGLKGTHANGERIRNVGPITPKIHPLLKFPKQQKLMWKIKQMR